MQEQHPPTATATPPLLPQPILTTDRLMVRPLHPQDAPSMSRNANSPLVTKYMSLSFPDPYTLSHSEAWIALNLSKPNQEHFGICEKSTPEIVLGGIGLKAGTDVNAHTAEIGFWIGAEFWGQGYATEILDAFTTWAFSHNEAGGKKTTTTTTTRIWGGVFSGNSASMRCFEKCGYVAEGVLKGHCEKHGEVMDLHIFGLTMTDGSRTKGTALM